MMYNARPGLLIGFHGCDKSRQQQLLTDSTIIPMSDKPFDWLGHGMYFWENNYDRALEWAREKMARRSGVKEPAVIGAVIDLHYCCDLLDNSFIKMTTLNYGLMSMENASVGSPMPVNKDIAGSTPGDRVMRYLDCATIEFMHEHFRKEAVRQIINKGYTSVRPFDSVRGAFLEGGEAFPGAGISAKTHIQICIRNPNCIKGFFQKREEVDFIQFEISRT